MEARTIIRMGLVAFVLVAGLVFWPKGSPRLIKPQTAPHAISRDLRVPAPKHKSEDLPNFDTPPVTKSPEAISLENQQSEFEINTLMQDATIRLGEKLSDEYCAQDRDCCSYSEQSELRTSQTEIWFMTAFDCRLTEDQVPYYANYSTYVTKRDGEWVVKGDTLSMIRAQN